MIEHKQCCFVRHHGMVCCPTMSLLAFALCLLSKGEKLCSRLVPKILFQRNFEIGLSDYDMEIVFVLGCRAVLFI
jgi:hypothetical protein